MTKVPPAMMGNKKRVLIAILAVTVSAIGYWIWTEIRPYESNEFAVVSWQVCGRQNTAFCHVTDWNNHPLAGCFVNIDNNSGGNGEKTDQNGDCIIHLGETEVLAIDVDEFRVVNRSRADMFQTPSVANGLKIDIRLRQTRGFSQPERSK